jgi:hypothetical protein
LLLLGLLLLLGEAGGIAAQQRQSLVGVIFAVLFEGAVWAAAAGVVRRDGARQSLFLILAVAALLRLAVLPALPYLSTDIYRYVWDGRVAAAGINPYFYVPNDPHLAWLRDAAIYSHINRGNYAPTIYPPAAQLMFRLAAGLGSTVFSVKCVMVAAEAVGIAALISVLRAVGRPRPHILLYAWHPLPVWEIAGSGHVDAAVVMMVALSLAAAGTGRRTLSAAALAAASLVKFIPAVLAPALWRPTRANRGDWRWPTIFAAVVVILYLPYIDAGPRVLGFFGGYLAEENLASGDGFWLLALARHIVWLPVAAYLGLAAMVMAGLAIAALRRDGGLDASLAWATRLAAAALFFLSPHYAWYFVWLVALLCLAPWWPAWWPTLTAILLYRQSETGQLPPAVGSAVYGGFAALAAIDIVRRLVLAARCRAADGRDARS